MYPVFKRAVSVPDCSNNLNKTDYMVIFSDPKHCLLICNTCTWEPFL